jgi:hypothetical protein
MLWDRLPKTLAADRRVSHTCTQPFLTEQSTHYGFRIVWSVPSHYNDDQA